jgi:hypothetical protein
VPVRDQGKRLFYIDVVLVWASWLVLLRYSAADSRRTLVIKLVNYTTLNVLVKMAGLGFH